MASNTLAKSVATGLGAACAALLSACAPSPAQVVAQHRPAVEAVFAKVKALEPAVRDTPVVTEDKVDLGGARVVLEGENENALFIRAGDVAAPANASADSDANGGLHANRIQVCGEALNETDPDTLGKGVGLYLEECARAEYVFVLRPTVDGAATLLSDTAFAPGQFKADVLLFRLADGVLLGGFTVAETSSDQVSVLTDEHGTPLEAGDRLNSDMSSRVFVAINEKLRANVPGSLPPL